MNTLPKQHRETWLPASRRKPRRGLLVLLLLAIALVSGTVFAVVYMQHSLLIQNETPSYGVEQESESFEEPSGTSHASVFDDNDPMISNLTPELQAALEAAASDAQSSGVYFEVNSGWRSVEEQERLFADAVQQYGSEREAARWVAPPSSMHVQGKAVDIGPMTSTDWLAQFGSDYGLCQTYSNELWHYEYIADAVDNGCPVAYADASEDPRL